MLPNERNSTQGTAALRDFEPVDVADGSNSALGRSRLNVRIPPKANGQVLGAGLNCLAATNKCLAHFNKSGMQAKATKKCVADIAATDLARPNGPPPHHTLAALEDRSMSEESNKQCSICFRRYTEFGHPAEPVRSGRCCNACNDLVVIPARLRAMRKAREREQDQQN